MQSVYNLLRHQNVDICQKRRPLWQIIDELSSDMKIVTSIMASGALSPDAIKVIGLERKSDYSTFRPPPEKSIR